MKLCLVFLCLFVAMVTAKPLDTKDKRDMLLSRLERLFSMKRTASDSQGEESEDSTESTVSEETESGESTDAPTSEQTTLSPQTTTDIERGLLVGLLRGLQQKFGLSRLERLLSMKRTASDSQGEESEDSTESTVSEETESGETTDAPTSEQTTTGIERGLLVDLLRGLQQKLGHGKRLKHY